MNISYSFLITTIAGLSTLLGFFIIFIKKDKNKIIVSSLSFSAGVMICISLIDLLPESIIKLNNYYNKNISIIIFGIFLSIGVLLSMFINSKIDNQKQDDLYKVGIISMIAIVLHNVPEGIITFLTSTDNLKLGIMLSIAITMHNVPEGISISVPIYYSTKNKKKAFLSTFISSISEPLGAVIAFIFLKNIVNDLVLGILLSFTVGIMTNISIYELLPEVKKYNDRFRTFIFFFLGFLVMIISKILIG